MIGFIVVGFIVDETLDVEFLVNGYDVKLFICVDMVDIEVKFIVLSLNV